MQIMIADVYAARQSYVIMFLVAMLLESNLFFTKRVIFLFWISVLCTAFPLGLNDRVEGVGNVSKLGDIEYSSLYFSLAITRRKRGHGRKKKIKRNLGLEANSSDLNLDSIDEKLLI